MIIYYVCDQWDIEGYGVVPFRNESQHYKAIYAISKLQTEYNLNKEIIVEDNTLQFAINDRQLFREIKSDFYRYIQEAK